MFIETQADWSSNEVEAGCDSWVKHGVFRVDWPRRDTDAGRLKPSIGVSHGLCRQGGGCRVRQHQIH